MSFLTLIKKPVAESFDATSYGLTNQYSAIMKGSTMLDKELLRSNRIKARFRVYYKGLDFKEYEVRGKVARTIGWLVLVGSKGVTALEISSWALRLADYVHTLRHDYGVPIGTIMEPHDGGEHARYVLLGPVEILSINRF